MVLKHHEVLRVRFCFSNELRYSTPPFPSPRIISVTHCYDFVVHALISTITCQHCSSMHFSVLVLRPHTLLLHLSVTSSLPLSAAPFSLSLSSFTSFTLPSTLRSTYTTQLSALCSSSIASPALQDRAVHTAWAEPALVEPQGRARLRVGCRRCSLRYC
jgi:hypothetical protein